MSDFVRLLQVSGVIDADGSSDLADNSDHEFHDSLDPIFRQEHECDKRYTPVGSSAVDGDWSFPCCERSRHNPPNFGIMTANWGGFSTEINPAAFLQLIRDIHDTPAELLCIQVVSPELVEAV